MRKKLLLTRTPKKPGRIVRSSVRLINEEGHQINFNKGNGRMPLLWRDLPRPFFIVEVSDKIYNLVCMQNRSKNTNKFIIEQLKLIIKEKFKNE